MSAAADDPLNRDHPVDGYDAMRFVIQLYSERADNELADSMTRVADLLAGADVLQGLAASDSVHVGTCLMMVDLVTGGLERLYWRTKRMHESTAIFADRAAAVAAQAHAIAVLELEVAA